jgi:predicted metal-dependent hydrolase
MDPQIPAPLRRFAELWAAGEFWECHEVLETPWRSSRSGFYKGMILLASGWVHVQRRNPVGIRAQLRKAIAALEPYRPTYLGVEVEMLIRHAAETIERVAAVADRSDAEWLALLPPPPVEPSAVLIRGDEPELSD